MTEEKEKKRKKTTKENKRRWKTRTNRKDKQLKENFKKVIFIKKEDKERNKQINKQTHIEVFNY